MDGCYPKTLKGNPLFPLWPAKEYALLCAEGDWSNAKPKAIPLKEILEELLPTLKENQMLPSIFPVPSTLNAVVPEIDLLVQNLLNESEQYK